MTYSDYMFRSNILMFLGSWDLLLKEEEKKKKNFLATYWFYYVNIPWANTEQYRFRTDVLLGKKKVLKSKTSGPLIRK